MAQIITGAPLWAWPLLALLAGLGVRGLKTRPVSVWTLAVLPAVAVVLGVVRVAKAPAVGTSLIVSVLCAAAFVAFGARRARSIAATFDRPGRRITLPGSSFTLVFGLSIFAINYAFGVAFGMNPALAADPLIALAPVAVGGALSGFVLGRHTALFRRYQTTP